MIATVLGWLVIVFGVCWLLVKYVRGSGGHEKDPEDGDPHGPFRK